MRFNVLLANVLLLYMYLWSIYVSITKIRSEDLKKKCAIPSNNFCTIKNKKKLVEKNVWKFENFMADPSSENLRIENMRI